jgi:hypothetical protein
MGSKNDPKKIFVFAICTQNFSKTFRGREKSRFTFNHSAFVKYKILFCKIVVSL